MNEDAIIATIVLITVTASFPFYIYGAWIILREKVVTWGILIHHLKFIFTGLVLTTVPIIVWMIPRSFSRLDGYIAVHTFVGLQAYAFLIFALTGIIKIFNAKRSLNLYQVSDDSIPIDELGKDMDLWRKRLRIGVMGYLLIWIIAWSIGVIRYFQLYYK
jgi:hypothetical protein